MQQTTIEIVAVLLSFYNAFNRLTDIFLFGIQLALFFDDSDLFLNLGDLSVAALVHKLEVLLGDGSIQEFLQRPLFFLLFSFQFPVQSPQIGTAIVSAILQNTLYDAGEVYTQTTVYEVKKN